MRRRAFIVLLGAAVAHPLPAPAQQPLVGYLGSGSAERYAELLRAFRQGLKEIGYVEGQNLAIEYRWMGQNDQLPTLATDLDDRKLTAIVAAATPQALALHAATSTIPIIFVTAAIRSYMDSWQASTDLGATSHARPRLHWKWDRNGCGYCTT